MASIESINIEVDRKLADTIRDLKEQVYYLTGDCMNMKGKIDQLEKDKAELSDMVKQCRAFIMAWIPDDVSPMQKQFAKMLNEIKSIEELLK